MGFNAKSLKLLTQAHPDLVKVAMRARELSPLKFEITQVARTPAQQRRYLKAGASRTLKSRHLIAENGFAHALDFIVKVGGVVTWALENYATVADAFKAASRDLGIPIEWGGDWKGLVDGPHIQLPWKQYPGTKAASAGHNNPPAEPTEAELGLDTLQIGMVSDAVADLQGALNALGASPKLVVDRHFGARTRDALRQVTAAKFGKAETVATPRLRVKLAKAARQPL